MSLFWRLILTLYGCASCCIACKSGSPEVGTCLHVYLERDFSSIEAILYPRKLSGPTESPVLLDGPELEVQCNYLREVMECLEELQYSSCYYYQDFFTFRHLVKSLRKTLDWACEELRDRFRQMLISFPCIENLRKSMTRGQTCYRESLLVPNLWQRIIRLESGVEICHDLRSQVNCITSGKFSVIGQRCPQAETVYRNLTELFLHEWCGQNSSVRNVPRPRVFAIIMLTIVFLSGLLL